MKSNWVSNPTSKRVRGARVTRACDSCKQQYQARVADVKRGWGLTCSKACASKERERLNKVFRKLTGERK